METMRTSADYGYSWSRAAVKHMAASLGVEWAKKGVRVNTLRYVVTS